MTKIKGLNFCMNARFHNGVADYILNGIYIHLDEILEARLRMTDPEQDSLKVTVLDGVATVICGQYDFPLSDFEVDGETTLENTFKSLICSPDAFDGFAIRLETINRERVMGLKSSDKYTAAIVSWGEAILVKLLEKIPAPQVRTYAPSKEVNYFHSNDIAAYLDTSGASQ